MKFKTRIGFRIVLPASLAKLWVEPSRSVGKKDIFVFLTFIQHCKLSIGSSYAPFFSPAKFPLCVRALEYTSKSPGQTFEKKGQDN